MYSRTALEIRDRLASAHYWCMVNRDGEWIEPFYEWIDYCVESDYLEWWLNAFYPGWSYIGCGSYRIALRNPAGDVTKIDIDNLDGNASEISTYKYIINAYPECTTQAIRPVKTWHEYVDKDIVVFQSYVDTCSGWIDWDDNIAWIHELSDGLQGGVTADGIAYIWDLQF